MNPMTKWTTLNEVYNEWKSEKGFFHFLYYYFAHASPLIECPFIESEQTAILLDMKYHGGFSGNKIVSPFVETYLDDFDGMQDAYFVRFAEIFWKLNSENLIREYEIMTADYNPLNNYDMTEISQDTRGGTQTFSGTTSGTTANTGTDTTRTNTDITTESDANGNTVERDIYGFNSSGTPVPADKTTTKDKTTTSGTGTDNYTEIEHGLNVSTGSASDSTTTDNFINNHSLTRSGNIGVTQSVEMLEKHGKFWNDWNFYENVLFPAVDRLLTIPIY